MKGLVLDAGALIAIERHHRTLMLQLEQVFEDELTVVVPAGALAQAWRDGRRQSRLARFMNADGVIVAPLDDLAAREAGQLCGLRRTADIVDASVVLCARHADYAVMTTDPDDLALLDPTIELHQGAATLMTNDNWRDNANAGAITTTAARIGATPFEASDSKSSALLTTLQPGVYSFIASGKNNTSGIVLVEVYDAD